MRFRVQVGDLNEALSLVSVVTPRPIGTQGSGYLFRLSGTTCMVYSQDASRKVRTSFEVTDVEGEGSFVLPVDKTSALKYLDGYADFTASKSGDRYVVSYESETGARQEFTTFDPMSIKPFDDEMDDAKSTDTYPVAVLREGLSLMKTYISPVGDAKVSEESFKALHLFDGSTETTKKGNGYFYAADKIRVGYFYCEALKDKSLSVHGQHLPTLLGFLSKCEGDVQLLTCQSTTFVKNSRGQVFGWARQAKQADKFAYYNLKLDGFVLRVPKDQLVKALRYIRGGLDSKADKIRLQYSHETPTLRIIASEDSSRIESAPVGVRVVEESDTGAGAMGSTTDFAFNLNLNQFLDIVDPVKGNEVMLRVVVPKEDTDASPMLRTIEEFFINDQGRIVIHPAEGEKAYQCKVTRYMPSRK